MSNDFIYLLEGLFDNNLPIIVKSKGGSMRPTIHQDAVVRLEAVALDLIRKGDVVLYVQDDMHTVMHRVVRKIQRNGTCLIQTWGDNMAFPDTPVMLTAVKARVTAYQTGEGEWCTLKSSRLSYLRLFLLRYCWYWWGRLFSKLGRL